MVELKLLVLRDYNALSEKAASIVIETLHKKPNALIGLPAGSTPVGCYKKLVEAFKKGTVDFSKAFFFNLDEYIGLRKGSKFSFEYFLKKKLFNHLNVPKKNLWFINAEAKSHKKECEKFEQKLLKKGIDLMLLGIGVNGHIAFNEPGSSFDSRTRVVPLSVQTIESNSRFFKKKEEVPRWVVTVGIKTIMSAKKIVLLASGKKKAYAIKAAFEGRVSEQVPASILQTHKNSLFLVDVEAASKLKI